MCQIYVMSVLKSLTVVHYSSSVTKYHPLKSTGSDIFVTVWCWQRKRMRQMAPRRILLLTIGWYRQVGYIHNKNGQGQAELKGTKYRHNWTIMRWGQVTRMMMTMNRCVMRVWVHVWRH